MKPIVKDSENSRHSKFFLWCSLSFFDNLDLCLPTLQISDIGEVSGEHKIEYYQTFSKYVKLVEDTLGVSSFCSENTCSEKELFDALQVKSRENEDARQFVEMIVIMADYNVFTKMILAVRENQMILGGS